jgi:hypothetical protein
VDAPAPAVTGASWKQSFDGAKLLRVWGNIDGRVADYAGKSFATEHSLDILAYLLQQDGAALGLANSSPHFAVPGSISRLRSRTAVLSLLTIYGERVTG